MSEVTTKPRLIASKAPAGPSLAFDLERERAQLLQENKQLKNLITDLDALCQEGFAQIGAAARSALRGLEAPGGWNANDLVMLLRIIASKADDIENCINAQAEAVGCNWTDDELRRTAEAWSASRQ